jgi:hypothetical protein
MSKRKVSEWVLRFIVGEKRVVDYEQYGDSISVLKKAINYHILENQHC